MSPAVNMTGVSEYEQQRIKNLEENRKILESIRQEQIYKFDALKPKAAAKKKEKKAATPRPKKKPRIESKIKDEGTEGESVDDGRRKSARLRGKKTEFKGYAGDDSGDEEYEEEAEEDFDEDDEEEDDDDDDDEDGEGRKRKRPKKAPSKPHIPVPKNRPNFYGAVPGVEVGRIWETRMACSRDGVQRPPVAGIHGGPEGAYSIALSGGYEDDVDLGDCFTYTGEGGRELRGTKDRPKNLRTAPQSKDQTLTRGNLALSLNIQSRKPVRVIRGSNLQNEFAPDFGYRYDGLYTVEKYWSCIGKAGFKVFKFALRRCADQEPPPWVPNPYDYVPTPKEDPDSESGNKENCDDNKPAAISISSTDVQALKKDPDSDSASNGNCDDNKPPASLSSTETTE